MAQSARERRINDLTETYGCAYLNNDGTRWTLPRKKRAFVLYVEGERVGFRHATCFESFGNFACWVFRFRGKTHKRLPREEREQGPYGLPVPVIHM